MKKDTNVFPHFWFANDLQYARAYALRPGFVISLSHNFSPADGFTNKWVFVVNVTKRVETEDH